MDNQHKLIKGYRDLSQQEIDLINEIKVKAEEVGALVERATALYHTPLEKDDLGQYGLVDTTTIRSVSIAKTELQTGFMWLIRSIARPNGF